MSWATGNAAVIDASNYCAESILSSLKTCRPISLSLFVTAVKSIARAPNYSTDAIKSVRFVHLIGSTVTMAILQAAQKTFPRAKMLTSFAKTEPTATTSWPAGRPPTMDKMPSWHGIASSGKVAAGAALKVVDAQGKIVKRGQVGSLHLRGSSVISRYVDGGGGYSNSNDAFYTGEDGHQWFVSGDDALIDDKGFLYVLGRSEYTLRREGQVIIACSVEDFLEMQFQGSTAAVVNINTSQGDTGLFAIFETAIPASSSTEVQRVVVQSLGPASRTEGAETLGILGFLDWPLTPGSKFDYRTLRRAIETQVASRLTKP